jgi:hypothetical protein
VGQVYDLTRVYESVPEAALWLAAAGDVIDDPVLMLRNQDWTTMLSMVSSSGEVEYLYGWVYLGGMYRLCIRWPDLHLALVVDFPDEEQLLTIMGSHCGQPFKLALCDSRDIHSGETVGVVLDTLHFNFPI